MHTDPIADMITRMRNSLMAWQVSTRVPYSKVKESILEVLKSKTFIKSFSIKKDSKFPEIEIVFNPSKRSISLDRVSKPGQKIYVQSSNIQQVKNGYGISVISTSEWVMAGFEAYKKGIGWEILINVY